MMMEVFNKTALTLLIIGGINWGCVGIFGFDLVAFFFGGAGSAFSRVIYTLVGLSALWCISLLFHHYEPVEHKV
jgi:uncharacterized membrane protein YuzA (DUF378 family)